MVRWEYSKSHSDKTVTLTYNKSKKSITLLDWQLRTLDEDMLNVYFDYKLTDRDIQSVITIINKYLLN